MNNIPNQYHIYIKKPKEYREKVFTANYKNINKAGEILSPNTFRVYLWFLQQTDKELFDLFAKDVMKDLNISQSSYDRTIRELKKEKYLIYSKADGRNPEYNFYEEPNGGI